MPNYKSENITFLTIAEMTSMQVDSTDQTGLLFALITGPTTFKMVMWFKNNNDTVDNESVYPANGSGRWIAQPVGEVNTKEVLTVVGDTLPGTISGDIDMIALKKTDGTKELRAKFDGVFENLLGTSSEGGSGAGVAYYLLNATSNYEGDHLNFESIPLPSDRDAFSLAVIDVMHESSYEPNQHHYYLYCWIPRVPSHNSGYVLLSSHMGAFWEGLERDEANFPVNKGVTLGEIRHRDRLNDIPVSGPYDNYADWFIWDKTGKWVALVTKDNATNQASYVRTKCWVDHQGLVIGGEALSASDIPNLDTTKITSGTFNIARLPVGTTSTTVARGDHTHVVSFSTLSGVGLSTPVTGQVLGFNGFIWTNVNAPSGTGSGTVTLTGDITGSGTGDIVTTLANIGTAGTYVKVTTDAKGRVLSGSSLIASDIPFLDAGKITTGIFDITRIPNLSTSKITSGTFDISFIPTGTTSTTVALGNHNHTFSSLSDVSLTSPSNGQILSFDSATSQWKNTTLPAGTGAVNSVDGAFGDVILTNTYQAKSNELTAIAGLADTVGYIRKTGDGVYVLDNNVSGGVSSIDGLTGVVSLTNTYQAKSNELTAFSNLPDTVGFIKKTADGAYIVEDIAGGVSGVASVDGLTGTVVLSDRYLALTGDTVTGITTFSSNTPSTSTTTGAVKISNGGLAVAGSGYFGGDLSHNGYLKKNGIGSVGWISMTGTADKSAELDTATATLTQLAQRVKAMQDALSLLGVLEPSGDDPFGSSVLLFLKGNGSDGSTSIIDSSPVSKTVARVGDAKISSTQSKYGGSSIYFDGSGDLLQINHSSFNFAENDFTIEFWIYPINSNYFLGKGDAASSAGSALSFAPQFGADIYYNGSATSRASISFILNEWQHIAIVRNGTSYKTYRNGTEIGSVVLPVGATINTVSSPLQFGGYAGSFINAYFDSIRVSSVARYTTSFNPETDTYLD